MPLPPIPGISTVSRIAYTANSRRGEPKILSIASNADLNPGLDSETKHFDLHTLEPMPSSPSMSSARTDSTFSSISSDASSASSIPEQEDTSIDGEKKEQLTIMANADSSDSDLSEDDIRPITSHLTRCIALFPHYLTQSATKLTLTEGPLPSRGGTFSITSSIDPSTEILKVTRGRLSFSDRRYIASPETDAQIMCIRQDIGKVPRSYRFDDPTGTKILDLQGNFFNVVKGPKSTALFTNAMDGAPARLHMQGSFKRRHASIKDMDTDEVLASMSSELWNAKSLGGRRTYEIEVAEGVDIVLVVGLIVALDARGSFVGPGQLT